ncbi:uncharacterized protein LOC123311691 [Coccinella septempunctata]|uniref:uncharacterized protein LOC123311691 n=1 Tax=Coccinella septempunctata TaxID=41139 RepID=UPI001D090036|nr:uncharacterized protein LOC123311691 [Coccinella septempunctata]
MSEDNSKSSEVDDEVRTLIKNRGIVKAKMTRMENWFKQDKPLDIVQCKLRLEQLMQIFKDYDNFQTKLEVMDYESHHQDREIMEDKYFDLISFVTKIVNQSEDTQQSNSSTDNRSTISHSSIKLPEISIPNFSGDIKHWPSFFELFTALITNNQKLSNVQKLIYLKSALTGEPLQLIENLEVIGLNFPIAINTLRDRFDNKYLIVNAYIRNLLNVPSLTKGNDNNLRNFISQIKTNLAALNTYNLSEKLTDLILIQIFTQKLDFGLRKEFEGERNVRDFPTLPEFIQFLERKYKVLENLSESTQNSKLNSSHKNNNTSRSSYHVDTSDKTKFFKCFICGTDEHRIYSCKRFLNLSPNDRHAAAKAKNACLNCLSLGHTVQSCYSQRKCSNCQRSHHSLLHFNKNSSRNSFSHSRSHDEPSRSTSSTQASSHLSTSAQSYIPVREEVDSSAQNLSSLSVQSSNNEVLLATACVKLYNSHNQTIIARCFTDSASQKSFVTEDLVRKLNLKTYDQKIQISGISQSCSMSNRMIDLKIHSLVHTDRKFSVSCAVLKTITCKQPQLPISLSSIPIPMNIQLADIHFNTPSNVDILLGADIYFDIITDGIIKLGPGLPVLQNSHLGYLIAGNIPQSGCMSRATHLTASQYLFECTEPTANPDDMLNDTLTKFWEIEEVQIQSESILTQAEQQAEQIFKDTTFRLPSGRFQVDLPFKGPNEPSKLVIATEVSSANKTSLITFKRRLKSVKPDNKNSAFFKLAGKSLTNNKTRSGPSTDP